MLNPRLLSVCSFLSLAALGFSASACKPQAAPAPTVDENQAVVESGQLFDSHYESGCPDSEKDPSGKCKGLYPVRGPSDGTEAALLINGEMSWRARMQILLSAKKTIDIQALVIRGDEAGLYVTNLLRAKQAEGVKVRVIMDAASNPEPTTWWMYTDLMVHPGLEPIWVKGYGEVVDDLAHNNHAALNQRFHDKLWIIDGKEPNGIAVLGGLNVANEYFRADQEKPSLLWRDQDMIVRGPVIKDLVDAFEVNNEYFLETQQQPAFNKIEKTLISATKDGKQLPPKVADVLFMAQSSIKDPIHSIEAKLTDSATGAFKTQVLALPFPVSEHVIKHLDDLAHSPLPLEQMFRPIKARFIHNRPRLAETYIRDAYIERLKSVTREALIANAYFLPNPPMAEAIKTAAGLPGVTLNIITNSPETNDLKELSYASRHMYKGLMDAGSHVFEWRGDKHGQGTIHAKFAVFDRTSAIIGSYNLDPRSEQLNSETVLAFESPELAGELANQYLTSDLSNSEAVDAATAQTYFENKEWGLIQAETFLSLSFKGML